MSSIFKKPPDPSANIGDLPSRHRRLKENVRDDYLKHMIDSNVQKISEARQVQINQVQLDASQLLLDEATQKVLVNQKKELYAAAGLTSQISKVVESLKQEIAKIPAYPGKVTHDAAGFLVALTLKLLKFTSSSIDQDYDVLPISKQCIVPIDYFRCSDETFLIADFVENEGEVKKLTQQNQDDPILPLVIALFAFFLRGDPSNYWQEFTFENTLEAIKVIFTTSAQELDKIPQHEVIPFISSRGSKAFFEKAIKYKGPSLSAFIPKNPHPQALQLMEEFLTSLAGSTQINNLFDYTCPQLEVKNDLMAESFIKIYSLPIVNPITNALTKINEQQVHFVRQATRVTSPSDWLNVQVTKEKSLLDSCNEVVGLFFKRNQETIRTIFTHKQFEALFLKVDSPLFQHAFMRNPVIQQIGVRSHFSGTNRLGQVCNAEFLLPNYNIEAWDILSWDERMQLRAPGMVIDPFVGLNPAQKSAAQAFKLAQIGIKAQYLKFNNGLEFWKDLSQFSHAAVSKNFDPQMKALVVDFLVTIKSLLTLPKWHFSTGNASLFTGPNIRLFMHDDGNNLLEVHQHVAELRLNPDIPEQSRLLGWTQAKLEKMFVLYDTYFKQLRGLSLLSQTITAKRVIFLSNAYLLHTYLQYQLSKENPCSEEQLQQFQIQLNQQLQQPFDESVIERKTQFKTMLTQYNIALNNTYQAMTHLLAFYDQKIGPIAWEAEKLAAKKWYTSYGGKASQKFTIQFKPQFLYEGFSVLVAPAISKVYFDVYSKLTSAQKIALDTFCTKYNRFPNVLTTSIVDLQETGWDQHGTSSKITPEIVQVVKKLQGAKTEEEKQSFQDARNSFQFTQNWLDILKSTPQYALDASKDHFKTQQLTSQAKILARNLGSVFKLTGERQIIIPQLKEETKSFKDKNPKLNQPAPSEEPKNSNPNVQQDQNKDKKSKKKRNNKKAKEKQAAEQAQDQSQIQEQNKTQHQPDQSTATSTVQAQKESKKTNGKKNKKQKLQERREEQKKEQSDQPKTGPKSKEKPAWMEKPKLTTQGILPSEDKLYKQFSLYNRTTRAIEPFPQFLMQGTTVVHDMSKQIQKNELVELLLRSGMKFLLIEDRPVNKNTTKEEAKADAKPAQN